MGMLETDNLRYPVKTATC